MRTTSDLDTLDAWFLRIGILLYGGAKSWELTRGLFCKIALAGRQGIRAAVRKHWLYIMLAVLAIYVLLILFLALPIENYTGSGKAYMNMLSIAYAIYAVVETQISFSRLPKALMSNRNWIVLVSLLTVVLLVATLRVTANIMLVVMIFRSDMAELAELESSRFNTAVVAINMVGSAYFTGTEVFVYYLTTKMSQSCSPKLAVIMKLLAHANMFGALAGFCDIINQYVQLQTSEAIVMGLGTTSLSFYGRVFMLQDDLPAEIRSEARMEKWESSIPEKPPSIAQTMAAY